MPESVTDRPTKSHEYLFLLTKNERYYYDAAAIFEASDMQSPRKRQRPNGLLVHCGPLSYYSGCGGNGETRNKRSVWTIPTMPYSGAHFATFPEALVEPCILAGCPLSGLVFDPFIGSGNGRRGSRKTRATMGRDGLELSATREEADGAAGSALRGRLVADHAWKQFERRCCRDFGEGAHPGDRRMARARWGDAAVYVPVQIAARLANVVVCVVARHRRGGGNVARKSAC